MKTFCLALLSGTTFILSAAEDPAAPLVTSLGGYTRSLQAPARVATAPDGLVYVTEPLAGAVVVFDAFGRQVETRRGFVRPLGIAVDSQGRIHLAEEAPGRVSVFDAQWNFLYNLGMGDGEFQLPNHIAIEPGPGSQRVYVSDSKANEVKMYIGAALANRFGSLGQENGSFDFPAGICVSIRGEVFVVDQNNDRVQVFDSTGSFLRAFSLGTANPSGRSQAAFLDPVGRLYVADCFQGMVRVFNAASGASLSSVGTFGRMPGQLASPSGLALDANSRLLVTSANTRRLELYGLDSFLHLAIQPATGTIAAGSNLVLTVVSGGPWSLAYQWRKQGEAITGATNATLAIASAGLSDAGDYSVAVTGPSGTFTSGVTRVLVMVPPAISGHPQSQTVLQGSTVTLTVVAVGSALSYQWQRNGLNLDGATNDTLALPDVQPFQTGLYSAVVSNAVGIAVSAAAGLTVFAQPSVVEIWSPTLETNQLFHLTVNADPGFNYSIEASSDLVQWQSITNFLQDAGLFEFIDADSTNIPNRFYRIRWVP